MLFWFLVLVVSLATVLFVAAPLIQDRGAGKFKRFAAIAALGLAPIAAAAIYLSVGAPESLSPTFQAELVAQRTDPQAAIAAASPEERAAMINAMVEGLAANLQENPGDTEGWRMLARSYGVLGRAADSANAYRQLVARDANASAEDWRNYATAMLAARGPDAEGFSDDFRDALEKLQSFNQDDPLALFYLGIVAREDGEPERALGYWRRLNEALPEDAPILPQLQALIDETEIAAQP